MGAAFDQARELDAANMMRTYARKPVMFVSGDGMRLYDDDGREYLDFVSGIGAVNLGHAHPAVADAIAAQAAKLVHVSNLFYVEHRGELAAEINRLIGLDTRVFFSNSGAEANEGAFKLARKWAAQNKPGAYKIVTAKRSFHGRTLATLAATGQPSKQEAFKPLPEGFVHVELNDMDEMSRVVDDTVAAVMLEMVQGEGGVWPVSAEYALATRAQCYETNTLFMVDEVQTGFFRTGLHPFAYQRFQIKPDVITIAKALGNGLPIGAVCAQESVAAAFQPGDHGSTFAGGPLVCAAALATIAALEQMDAGVNAQRTGAYLQERLEQMRADGAPITDVRGCGLMVGASLSAPIAQTVAETMLERGLVVNHIGVDILRFLPPLCCTNEEVDTLCSVLSTVFREAAA